ncbi:MAG: hypothetical protein K0U74_06615 [Alphaproteobacteria bacterium]|nr:hypothetical protein [Alphaproteobacteria bacterium]
MNRNAIRILSPSANMRLHLTQACTVSSKGVLGRRSAAENCHGADAAKRWASEAPGKKEPLQGFPNTGLPCVGQKKEPLQGSGSLVNREASKLSGEPLNNPEDWMA